jgi:tRNA (guanine37-N1)-methyltransferase
MAYFWSGTTSSLASAAQHLRSSVRVDLLTTFPELFATQSPAVLGVSIPSRAIRAGKLEVVATNLRDYSTNKHRKTDDRPYGGGPGMVLTCQPLWDAVQAIEASDSVRPVRPCTRLLMTPQGQPLTQQVVEELAALPRLLIIAGHYEGIDERVIQALAPREISLGDYVLSGGEIAALVLIDAIARLQPGVLGDSQSSVQDSFSQEPAAKHQRLLDCPHYTKPREWQGQNVPDVLLSGDHQAINAWRVQQKLARTKQRRPDLLDGPAPRGTNS